METNENYKEILKLKELLDKEKDIPYEFKKLLDGYQIIIYKKDKFGNFEDILVDAIEHYGSYGHNDDLLEIYGGLTGEERSHDAVLGYLTAEEVLKRFKFCYKHNTSSYAIVKEESSNV